MNVVEDGNPYVKMARNSLSNLTEEEKETMDKISNTLNDKFETTEDERFVELVTNKDSFFVEIHSGAVLPIDHPNYYNGRIDISLCREFKNIECNAQIEKERYLVSDNTFSMIENYIKENLDKLINIAKNQTSEMYEGVSENIYIKCGSILLLISSTNVKNQEDFNCLGELIQNIFNMIKNS